MNFILMLIICIGLAGCASTVTPPKYISLYNQAVSTGQSVSIVKEGDYETLQQIVQRQVESVGYDRVLYSSPMEASVVLVKDIAYGNPLLNGDAKSYQLILKYTRLDGGRTRIDMVNAATTPAAKSAVDDDIRKLADLIKNS